MPLELTQILDNYVPKKKSRSGEDIFFGVDQDLPLWEKTSLVMLSMIECIIHNRVAYAD